MGAESRVYRPLEPLSHLQTVNYDAQIMGDSGQKWGKSAVYGRKVSQSLAVPFELRQVQ